SREDVKAELVLGALPPARSHFLCMRRVGQQGFNACSEMDRIAMRHQVPGHAVFRSISFACAGSASKVSMHVARWIGSPCGTRYPDTPSSMISGAPPCAPPMT